jgi:hypothetical protein
MSADAMVAEIAKMAAGMNLAVDHPVLAPLLVEARAPAFDAARCLAALKGQRATSAHS